MIRPRRRYKTKLEGWRIILKGHFELTYSYLCAWKRRKLRLRSEGKYKDTTIGILQWIPKIHEFGTRARFKASRSWSWKRIVIWQTDVKRSDSKKNGGKKYTLWRIIINSSAKLRGYPANLNAVVGNIDPTDLMKAEGTHLNAVRTGWLMTILLNVKDIKWWIRWQVLRFKRPLSSAYNQAPWGSSRGNRNQWFQMLLSTEYVYLDR